MQEQFDEHHLPPAPEPEAHPLARDLGPDPGAGLLFADSPRRLVFTDYMTPPASLSKLSVLRPGAPMFIIGALLFGLNTGLSYAGISADALILDVSRWIATYGLVLVMLAYFVEGLFTINFYWPGSFVLFVAAVGVSDPGELVALWCIANISAALSLSIDYFIGKHGAYRALLRLWSPDYFERFGRLVEKRGSLAILLIGFHINWLALFATFSGATRRRSYLRTVPLALISHALWLVPVLWLVSSAGKSAMSSSQGAGVIVGTFFVIGAVLCALELARKRFSANSGKAEEHRGL